MNASFFFLPLITLKVGYSLKNMKIDRIFKLRQSAYKQFIVIQIHKNEGKIFFPSFFFNSYNAPQTLQIDCNKDTKMIPCLQKGNLTLLKKTSKRSEVRFHQKHQNMHIFTKKKKLPLCSLLVAFLLFLQLLFCSLHFSKYFCFGAPDSGLWANAIWASTDSGLMHCWHGRQCRERSLRRRRYCRHSRQCKSRYKWRGLQQGASRQNHVDA